MASIGKVSVFLLMLIIILNPYTIVGPLAYFLIPLLAVPFLYGFRYIRIDTIVLSLSLIAISCIGVFSSFLNGIGQFVHLKVALSIFVYILLAYSISIMCSRVGYDFNGLIYVSLLVAVINSSIILVQVVFPPFRDFTESLLVLSGNVDWSEGFRYRGIASGGGASLSVLIPVAMALALHLYSEKSIGVIKLIIILSVLLVSLFFIGRTGFVLIPIVFMLFFLFNLSKYLFKILTVFFVASALVVFLWDGLKTFIVDKYGIGFYNYSFGFLLGGAEGLNEEGTVSMILDFLKVIPASFPEVLIGYGFYGGSDFEPWTDSGYSRMFLSVGYIFGVMFYVCFFMIFRNVLLGKKFIFLTIGCVLLIAEAKEPLLFSGYASRVYIFILVYALVEYNANRYIGGRRGNVNFKYDIN